MTRPSPSRAAVAGGWLVGALALACSFALLCARAGPAVAGTRYEPPNIVVIQSDDQTLGQVRRRVQPKTAKFLIDPGTTFTNYFATTAECCPSRASLITGQYAHNDGVTSNEVGYPGLRDKQNVLPVWLQRSGYRTMHVGAKYLNGYREFAQEKVAPGWSNWFTVLTHTRYYNYTASVDGQRVHFGHRRSDYVTRVLGRRAKGLIDRYAPDRRPFYLQLDEGAPHVTRKKDPYGKCDFKPVPDPRDEHAFAHARLPRPPSFNERNMGDKPAFLRGTPLVGPRLREHMRVKWRCALASLLGVDRNVAAVFNAVKRSGELNRTVFIYISDNGLFYGEHRLTHGKIFPYEEAIHVPLVVRMPQRYRRGAPAVDRLSKLVANIDLAPTILALAHGRPCAGGGDCRTMDGRSLMPLLTRSGHWPQDRALLNEYDAPKVPPYGTCKFAGIRTQEQIYIEHYRVPNPSTGKCEPTLQKERYNLNDDPFELNSLCYGGAPDSCPNDAEQSELERRLQELRRCAGIQGRDERVNSRPFCE